MKFNLPDGSAEKPYRFYLYDEAARPIGADALDTLDLLDALEHMWMLIKAPQQPYRVELWLGEEFVGHIARNEGRLVLAKRAEPLRSHPAVAEPTSPAEKLRAGHRA